MRVWPVVLLVAGCNQIFGIAGTDPAPLLDAQYFDAPADAPFSCPPTGETPAFSQQLNQIIQYCLEPSASTTGRAVAMCSDNSVSQVAEGPLEGPLLPLAGFEQTASTYIDLIRYSPEGDEIFVRIWTQGSVVGRIVVARKTTSGFTMHHDITLPSGETTDSFVRFGTPSRGPVRRMILRNAPEPGVREIEVDDAGQSTTIGTYTAADLEMASIGVPGNLSADGLRLVFQGTPPGGPTGIAYADRASLADRFLPARALTGVPISAAPYMTEDCARIYFGAINYMFWVQRR